MEAEELRFKLTIVEETHDELEDSYELQATGPSFETLIEPTSLYVSPLL